MLDRIKEMEADKRLLHRATKVPVSPVVQRARNGRCDPQSLLADAFTDWSKLWTRYQPQVIAPVIQVPLGMVTAADVRKAARSFPKHTTALDGFSSRHLGLLSHAVLRSLSVRMHYRSRYRF